MGDEASCLAVVSWAMVGMADGATFTEQFKAFSTDGYHVQVTPDGQEAKIVLDEYAGKDHSLWM